MKKKTKIERGSFRFRMSDAKWLTEEIARIELLATERIRAGVPHHSVQTGAISLLKSAMAGMVVLSAEPTLSQANPP